MTNDVAQRAMIFPFSVPIAPDTKIITYADDLPIL